jgi:hypothetical protein
MRAYAERWGIVFENLGATRMMGRVLGWLLVCDPPEQSSGELAEGLDASAGSISTATRALAQAGMIERVGVPGKRSSYFHVRPGMWGDLLKRRMSYGLTMGELADRGLEVIRRRRAARTEEGAAAEADRPAPLGPARSDREVELRLEEIRSYCRYVERELPVFIERWERSWDRERSAVDRDSREARDNRENSQ